jgi:hypothetical protein
MQGHYRHLDDKKLNSERPVSTHQQEMTKSNMRYQVVDVPMPTDAGPVYFQSRALFLFMLSPQQNTSTDIDHHRAPAKKFCPFLLIT